MSLLLTNESLWNWASPVWAVAAVIAALYGWMFRREMSGRSCWLAAAFFLLVAAFVSPLGVLADGYLFSAHMVQHLLLLLVIPLCLLLSLPPDRTRHWLDRPGVGLLRKMLSIPLPGWICGVGAMWLWHVPSLCSAATQSDVLGIVRSGSFLLAGTLFWWPIFAPLRSMQLRPPPAVVYLFSACLGCTLLGIYITFTTISVCPAFASPADRIGILTMLYDAGLTPAVDQQLGGLLMWVPPCSLYVAAIIAVMCRWFAVEDAALETPLCPRPAGPVVADNTFSQLP